MNDAKNRRKRVIKAILELIEELREDGGPAEDVNEPDVSGLAAERVPLCVPKSLPLDLQQAAARTAIEHNPLNAAHLGDLRAADAGVEVLPPARIAVEVQRYWGPRQQVLSVSFMESASQTLRNMILSHLNAWTKTAGISFQLTNSVGMVRITRAQEGYWSYIGTDIRHISQGYPTMCFQGFTERTSEKEYRRVVRHEAGHTLGFPHEHMREELVNRLDAQKCYAYFWRTQRWSRQEVDQQVLTPLNQRSIFATDPDETSIMCYQLPGEITKDGRPIIGGLDINATDYWFAGRIYPKQGGARSLQEVMASLRPERRQAAAAEYSQASIDEDEFSAVPIGD